MTLESRRWGGVTSVNSAVSSFCQKVGAHYPGKIAERQASQWCLVLSFCRGSEVYCLQKIADGQALQVRSVDMEQMRYGNDV